MPEETLEVTDTAFDDTEAGAWAARAAFTTASTTVDRNSPAKADSPPRQEPEQLLPGLTGAIVELVV